MKNPTVINIYKNQFVFIVNVLTVIFIAILAQTGNCQQVQIPTANHIRDPHTFYYGSPKPSKEYEFHIVLKNDTTIIERTNIETRYKGNYLMVHLKGKGYMVYPGHTKSVYRTTKAGLQLAGIPADSCWLFKAVTGKINAYSYLAEEGMTFVTAIQHGSDGPIVPLTRDNLISMVSSNAKALKIARKNNLNRAIVVFNQSN